MSDWLARQRHIGWWRAVRRHFYSRRIQRVLSKCPQHSRDFGYALAMASWDATEDALAGYTVICEYTGPDLDRVGAIYDIPRTTGESDIHYRERITQRISF